jgi:Winged helix-turn helix
MIRFDYLISDSLERMVKCTKKQIRQLKTALRRKLPAVQRERIQMVLLRENGVTQPAIAEAMGVSLSTVNRAHMAYLLTRHGWRKLMPRPFHPRRDIAAQNAFKKNGFPNAARHARRVAARRGCSLRIMFADEARLGRMNRPRPCWAPRATRPQVASQLIREYVYYMAPSARRTELASI